MAKNTFGIIGGDERQIYLARSMQEDGYEVSVCCLENARNTMGLRQTGMHSLVERCNVIILPLPATRDGCYLNTPLSNLEVRLDGDFARLFLNSRVFGIASSIETSSFVSDTPRLFSSIAFCIPLSSISHM